MFCQLYFVIIIYLWSSCLYPKLLGPFIIEMAFLLLLFCSWYTISNHCRDVANNYYIVPRVWVPRLPLKVVDTGKFCTAKKYLRPVSVASDKASYTSMRLQWPSKQVEDLASFLGLLAATERGYGRPSTY